MISTTTTTDHSSRVYNIINNNNRQPFKKVLIFFKEKVAVVPVIVAVKAVEAAVAVDVVGREPLEDWPSDKHLEPKLNCAVNLSSNF